MHRAHIASNEVNVRAWNGRQPPVAEHPRRDVAVVVLPFARLGKQLLVLKYPFVGSCAHRHCASRTEELGKPVIASRAGFGRGSRLSLEQPVQLFYPLGGETV